MAGLSSAQKARIDSALKRANTRLARLEDAFGRNSSTFKQQIATFEKKALNKYVGTSSSGHYKLDKGKIVKDIMNGTLNYDQANEILRNAAGVQLNSSGELVESKFGGIKTRKEVFDDTMAAIESGAYDLDKYRDENGFIQLNKKILKEITEELNVIAESFQTEYDDSPLTSEQMKSDPILSDLYSSDNGGTRNKRALTYSDLKDMAERLSQLRQEFDKEREEGAKTNDFLKNMGG